MITHLRFSLLVLFSTFLVTSAFSQQSKNTETMKVTQQLQALVGNVLHGSNLSGLKSSISQGAYVIEGASYQSMFESLYGENKSAVFLSEHDRHMSFLRLTITDDLNAAFLVVKTESSKHSEPRYHSVFFMKSRSGVWQIDSWHTSN